MKIKKDKGRLVKRSYVPCTYLAAAGLTLFLGIILSVIMQIYPFGPNSLLYTDGDQYFSFDAMFQRALLSNENLLYTWNMVLGGNALSMAAYYCLSPLNLLLIFFRNHLLLGVYVITMLKLLLASLFFCKLLNEICQGYFWEKPVFSAAYAFMGYTMAFIWNASWLDGVLILPLVLLGIIRLVREKKSLLYICSIAYAVISNFYIGFMICITSVLLYLAFVFYQAPSPAKEFKHSFLRYAGASLLGGALSAPVLLTVLFDMPEGRRKPLSEIFASAHGNFRLSDLPSMLFTGSMNPDRFADNLPIIFIGIAFEVLLLLYFFNRKISWKKKTVSLVLIGFFVLSFHNSVLNTIWHGFSGNLWFNFRYSFVFSFILLLMAFESFRNIRGLQKKDLLFGLAAVILLTGLMFRKIDISMLILDLLLAGAAILACYLVLKCPRKRMFISMGMCVLILLDLGVNSYFSIQMGSPRENMGPNPAYGEDLFAAREDFRQDMEFIRDDGFYRMDMAPYAKRCPAALFGYKGVTNFASTENKANLRFVRNAGMPKYACWCAYDGNSPLASQSLLGIRYVVSEAEISSREAVPEMAPSGHYIYRNPEALSVIFPVNGTDNSIPEIPFENINGYYSSITGNRETVFRKQEYSSAVTQEEGQYQYTYTFRTGSSSPLYFVLPEETLQEEDVLRDDILDLTVRAGQTAESRHMDRFQKMHYLGTWPEGTPLELVFTTGTPFEKSRTSIYYEDRTALQKCLSQMERPDIQEKSSSHLELKYDLGTEEQTFATTIPYDDGWTVWDNGKKLPLQKNWDNFLAFEIRGPGSHEITLRYMPKGLIPGLCIAAFAAAGMAAAYLIAGCCRRKKQKRTQTEQP